MDSTRSTVPAGRYRHYKNRDYIVLGVARHSETQEELVVYRTDYGDHSLWVRPLTMFTEHVEVEGRLMPRFRYIDDASIPTESATPDLPAPHRTGEH